MPSDRLEIDDSRYLAVPVVAALPVVFVDQYGESEDPKRNRFGETRQFPRTAGAANGAWPASNCTWCEWCSGGWTNWSNTICAMLG